ncbi:hypothetical protein K490DRAFT_46608 [Saccharata proteae CBS 121410]|uniref:Copper acquisition factor BIM1-like domain-containing protein n=1 Tax=Saccharata proteae CBS 121410 TaxID=1314787 RepID=A0A9P4LWW8_9PEZI|nr:hypothetical protein K490DRAFT_46608 [Saccharata proteae CBS 121410]
MTRFAQLVVALAATWSLAAAHTVITYPGWRGDNLHTNGTEGDGISIIPGSLGMNYDNDTGTYNFPYGMQWMYPCGGMRTTENRTKWPVTGGAVGVQPGWFRGHKTAFFYVNLGLGTEPPNMSHPMVPVFEMVGPTNNAFPGSFCLPQVGLPANISVNVGDNATIQVVEIAQHGAALYSCVDITFADPVDVAEVNTSNCVNTTGPTDDIGFNLVIATESLGGSQSFVRALSWLTMMPTVAVVLVGALLM